MCSTPQIKLEFTTLTVPFKFGVYPWCWTTCWSCLSCDHSRRHSDAILSTVTRFEIVIYTLYPLFFFNIGNFVYCLVTHTCCFSVEVKERLGTKGKGSSVMPSEESHEHDEEGLHNMIGLSLVLGFVFMLLIDQIGSSRSSRGKC